MLFSRLISPSPRAPKPRFLIDPIAFCGALVLAPVLVGLIGAPLIIPAFAVVFGGVPYLLIGVPVLLWLLPRYGIRPGLIGIAAAMSNVVLVAGLFALDATPFGSDLDLNDVAQLFLLFGTIMAAIWGVVLGLLYPHLERRGYSALNRNFR